MGSIQLNIEFQSIGSPIPKKKKKKLLYVFIFAPNIYILIMAKTKLIKSL